MRVDGGAGYFYASRNALTERSAARPNYDSPSFSEVAEENSSAGIQSSKSLSIRTSPDFTSMTRQEMRSWINEQIRSGKMTVDESTPFVSMTAKVRVSDGQIVPAIGDNERIDFIQRARLGIEGAISRSDGKLAARLQAALDVMLRA
jgi:hypothetical protein